MLLFAGHHVEKQGASDDVSSELIETAMLCAALCINTDYQLGQLGCSKQKIMMMNTLCDSINIEFHFSTTKDISKGPQVFYKPDCKDSFLLACKMQTELNTEFNIINFPWVGYYNSDQSFGVDLFLRSNQPSLIVSVDHWGNIDRYRNDRNVAVTKIGNVLRKLI